MPCFDVTGLGSLAQTCAYASVRHSPSSEVANGREYAPLAEVSNMVVCRGDGTEPHELELINHSRKGRHIGKRGAVPGHPGPVGRPVFSLVNHAFDIGDRKVHAPQELN